MGPTTPLIQDPFADLSQMPGADIAPLIVTALQIVLFLSIFIGLGTTTWLWVINDHKLSGQIRKDKAFLESQIDAINASLPDGNGTVFFDDEWVMAHGAAPARQFQLNGSLITTVAPGARRNYAVPDTDGIFVLDTTFPTEFSESAFFIVGDPNTGQMASFDLSLFGPAAVHVYRFPNKDGDFAMISDVVAIAGNTSEFLTSAFKLLGDPDTTKIIQFSADLITTNTNRTYFGPDLDGEIMLTTGNQTMSDKIVDVSNTLTVQDTLVTIVGATGSFQFDGSALTGGSVPKVLTVPDTDMTLVGRVATEWSYASLGIDGGSGTYNSINVLGTTSEDRFFRFRTGGSPEGYAGLTISSTDSHFYHIYADASFFSLTYGASAPATNDDLGDPVVTVDNSNRRVQVHDGTDATKVAELDVSGVPTSTTVTLAVPATSGTIALTSQFGGGSWAASVTPAVYTGTAVVESARYVRSGDIVQASLNIANLTTPAAPALCFIAIDLPVARTSGNFATLYEASGTAIHTNGIAGGGVTDAGWVWSTIGSETVTVHIRSANLASVEVAVTVTFEYDAS